MSLKTLILFCGLAALPAISFTAQAETKIPDKAKTGGFFISCQAYTFNHYSLFEAIQKTAESGGRVIEFFPGQKLSPEEPERQVGP